MAVTKQQVAELYVATFNRAPDAAGLNYWVNTSGLTIEGIAQSFFDQAETQALYPEGTTDTAFVTSIYTNLFNRAPDAAGLAYWVANLAAGTSRSVMIEAMKNGALGTDATIIANKATVGLYYADAGLEGDDFSLASVTAVQSTVDAAKADVAAEVGGSFEQSFNINQLATANAALTAFLVTADGDDDALTTASVASVNAGKTAAITALDVVVAGDYTGSSTAVRAALLADQQAANTTALTAANTALTTATANVAAVTGLTQAIATLNSATDSVTAATAVVTTASANLLGAEATYEALHAGVTIAANGTVTVTAGGAQLIDLVSGALVLHTGVTETTNVGITALLSSTTAKETADTALTAATAAAAAAQEIVDNLDLGAGELIALKAVDDAMIVVTAAVADKPTQAEIASEITGVTALLTQLATDISTVAAGADDAATLANLTAVIDAAVTDGLLSAANKTSLLAVFNDPDAADGDITNDFQTPATLAAELVDVVAALEGVAGDFSNGANQLVAFNTLVSTYNTAANTNALTGALATAEAGVTTVETTIETLADAIADLTAASSLVTDMTALQAAITAAEDVFTDAGLTVPASIAAGINYATAGDDIFLASTADGSITNFGLLGIDKIYIGSTYTVAADIDEGNNSVLEVFITEDGSGNAVISLEESVFGSNAATPEFVAITLTGVDMADVTISNGFVTVA